MADQEAAPSTTLDDAGHTTQADESVASAGTPVPAEPITTSPDPEADNSLTDGQKTAPPEQPSKVKQLARSYWAKKVWTGPLTVFVLLVVLLGVPATRYLLLGTFLHNQTKVVVFDAKSNKPVSGADVIIGSASGKTDLGGNVLLSPKLGNNQVLVSKKYYTSVSKAVTIGWPVKLAEQISLNPTGRLVPLTLTNKLTGMPIANAQVKSAGTETHTDKAGKATIVLPTTSATQTASISLDGFNTVQVTVQVTDQVVPENNFTLTPTGKLYFLSNQSGKIDVVKTNLDGTGRQTVLAGTGTEDAQTTSLLASRDWKYLALLAKHNGSNQSLYLINTANDQVTNIDGGSAAASFSLVGWSDDVFVYQVSRTNVSTWQSGVQSIKSYDAGTGKLYNIDQTQAEGTSTSDFGYNSFSSVYLLKNEVVYAKNWYSSFSPNHLSGKSNSLLSAKADGSNKKTVKDFPIPDGTQFGLYLNLAVYEPSSLYVQMSNGDGTNSYYQYEGGKLVAKSDLTDDVFNKPYPTFLASPTGKQTFWSEVRDNKNTLFIGDDSAQNPKQIAALSDYTPYGWYSDNYLLVSKNGSELYVLTPDSQSKPLKVTDYYKPQVSYRGYGGGYGGL